MKTHEKRVVTSLLVVVWAMLLSLSVFTAAAAQGDTVEIRVAWWGNQARHDATLAAVELFMKKHPNIKVLAEPAGWDGFMNKVAAEVAAKNEPDAFQFGDNTAAWAQAGHIYPLTEFVDSKVIDMSLISTQELCTYKGVLYLVPMGMNGTGMLYNKTLFDNAKVPYPTDDWTWEDFERIGKQVMQGNPGTYGSVDISLQQSDKNTIYRGIQMGTNWITPDLKMEGEPQLVEIFKFYERLRTEGFFPPPDETVIKNTQQVNFFGLGLAAMSPLPIGSAAMEQANLGDKGKVGIAMFPGSSTQPSGVTLTGGCMFAIGVNSKHKQEAAMFINFLANDPEAAMILKTVRGTPASSKARAAIMPNLSEIDKEIFSATDRQVKCHMPLGSVFNTKGAQDIFFNILKEEGETVAFKKATPEQAAKKAIARMQKSLDDANK